MTWALAALALSGPQLSRLANGIPVVTQTTADRFVSVEVLIRADDLSPLESGACETIAAALLGETENYSLRELRRLAWSIGGSVSTAWAGDCIRLSITTTPDRLRPTAALVSDALRKPTFSEPSLREARLASLANQAWIDETPPLRDLRNRLARHGLAPKAVTSLSQSQALALHARVFRPDRVALAVVGNVSADAVATAFGASLGLWEPKEAPAAPRLAADPARRQRGFQSALVTVAGPLPGSPNFAAWLVACVAFAEGKGGYLNREYRVRRGVSYLVGAYLTFRQDKAYCTFYVVTSGEPVDDLSRQATTYRPSAAEIARAKAYLAGRYAVGGPTEAGATGGFAVGHETPEHVAFWLAWWQMKGAGISMDAAFPGLVRAVTDEEVLAACDAWKPLSDFGK